jgi:glycosyltransferase involved in cell wall biosynthesis
LGLSDRFVIGITGRLRPEKGHKILFETIKQIKHEIPDLILVITGTGSLYHQLKQYANDLGIDNFLIFTDFRKDIPDILASFDLFIMPSLSEGLGTSVLEAAAAGIPIIASDIGGIPDIIEHEKSGLLVQPGQIKPLAEAIIRLYSKREIAQTYANSARERIKNLFSEKSLGNKTDTLYGRILSSMKKND